MNIRTTFLPFAIASVVILGACHEQSVTGPGFICDVTNPVRDILLNRSAATVLVHSPALASDTVQFVAVATNRLGAARSDVTVKFKSSDTTVATVDTAGVVHALRPGTAKITASACGESTSSTVTVIAGVTRVTVSPAVDTVLTGDSASVVARAFAPDGSQVGNVVFAFSSSSSSVAVHQTSDSTATYIGSSAGTVTITARGEGVSGSSSVLVQARGFLSAVSVNVSTLDAGDAFTCGLITTGRAFCWGLNNHGQLGAQADSVCFPEGGAAVAGDSAKTTTLPCSLNPLRISRDVDFQTISAGDSTGCALSIAGRAYCWGFGKNGQDGNGGISDRGSPTLVTSALTFATVTVGGLHACGLTTAGSAYCWGADSLGQLGDSRVVNSTTPIPVLLNGGQAVFASISAGFRHTCAVAADGTGYCWGDNAFGELGNGTVNPSDVPVRVGGNLTFSSISAGGDHTCGITTGGAAFCWGSNADGQLGTGSFGDRAFLPTPVVGGLSFTRISASTGTRAGTATGVLLKTAGHGHTCALTASGIAYCWGDDSDLQIGQGQPTGGGSLATSPVQVAQGERAGGVTFRTISAGSRHSCAVGSDGNAYCWGSNVMGALGNTLQAAFRGQPQKVATPAQ